jgi:hypothetical protein
MQRSIHTPLHLAGPAPATGNAPERGLHRPAWTSFVTGAGRRSDALVANVDPSHVLARRPMR